MVFEGDIMMRQIKKYFSPVFFFYFGCRNRRYVLLLKVCKVKVIEK